jgi:hypothetical protein
MIFTNQASGYILKRSLYFPKREGMDFAMNFFKIVMKKLYFGIMLTLISLSAMSQDSSMNASDKMMKQCVIMKKGLAMVVKNGDTTTLSSPLRLNDGATVMTDGTITMTDGKTKKLKNRQWVDMDGKIGTMKHPY